MRIVLKYGGSSVATVEKIQKIVVVQGDEVTYEENFNGIVYTGNWVSIQDEKCSDGAIMYSETERIKFRVQV